VKTGRKREFRAFVQRNMDTLELDENVYIERLRSAGVFKTFEDEVRERVGFRHFTQLVKEGVFDKPSRPTRARGVRKPSVRSLIKQAERAGKPVSSIERDGVKLGFGEQPADANQQNEVETWIMKHAH
jgi:hypothetical protein